MCDVGFLLLTFFILTTSFKPDEPITVDTPTSTSKFQLPENDVILIQVNAEGKIYFGIDGQPNRREVLDKISQKRSEERRVGKECVQPCRSRWSPYH